MIKLGLIGFPLGHSFSKNYYLSKFERENITGIDYDLYSLPNIEEFADLINKDSRFHGFNVTIPHKQSVLKFVTDLSVEAEEIGAVNCLTVHRRDDATIAIKGYNTDAFGFQKSLEPLLTDKHNRALVLGNGGAARAVCYVLNKLDIPYLLVSRNRENGDITYSDLDQKIIEDHQIIINCSPVGTFPNADECPNIPYEFITADHLLYDLIYNPEETLFLQNGKERHAVTKNGYEMLVLQAEKNWQIWKETF